MSGRPATTDVIPGDYALSVGLPPKQLPDRWQWFKLTDVAELATGHTPSRKHPEYWDGDIPWIGIKDARAHDGMEISSTLQTTNQLGLDNSAAVLLPRSTVCLSRTASVGYVTVMGRSMATSQDFVNWICSAAVVPKFLMYLFIAEKQSLFRFGKGTTHTTIYFPEVKALHAGIPPLPEQRRIVAKIEELFSDLDAGVAALQRAKANLKRYRAAVLKAAVEGKLTEQWRAENPDVEPASELLQRILAERRQRWEAEQIAKYEAKGKKPPKGWKEKYKEPAEPDADGLPELPTGWCWTTFEQLILRSEYGTSVKCDYGTSGVPVLRIPNIARGRIDLDDVKYATKRIDLDDDSRLSVGDLLMCRTNGSIRLIGKCAVIRSQFEKPHSFASYLLRFRFVIRDAVPLWVDIYSSSNYGRRFIESNAASSAGQHNISLSLMHTMPIPLPPIAEQEVLIGICEELDSLASASGSLIEANLTRAVRLHQSILKRAFEGKLVPQDPNDEPASELLARIKAERDAAESNGETTTIRKRKAAKKK